MEEEDLLNTLSEQKLLAASPEAFRSLLYTLRQTYGKNGRRACISTTYAPYLAAAVRLDGKNYLIVQVEETEESEDLTDGDL